jgi:hypothetical protein
MKNSILILVALSVAFATCKQSNQNQEGYLEDTQLIETLNENEYEKYEIPDVIQSMKSNDSTVINELRTCSVNEPRLLRTLNSGSKKFVYVIDKNNQGSASLFGIGNLELSKKEKIAIVDYVQFLDTICTPGTGPQQFKNIRLAAGVRLFLKIKKANKKVSVDIPSKVAAAAEFGLAEATFTIETIGFANEDTRKILSGLGESFDVESYVKIMGAVSEVMKIMKDSMEVKPVEIPLKK